MPLENRIAVITGASGGLGHLVARNLADRRVSLALLERDPAKLAALRNRLALPEARLLTHAVDLLEPDAVQRAAEAVVARFGRVDVLIHLVGGWTGGKTLLEAAPSELEAMLAQHVWTSFHVVRAFVPYMVHNGWGRILMVTSPFAAQPAAKGGPYAMAKAAQETLILTLAQELKGTGVTASVLQVKTIDTRGEKVSAPTRENASWTTPEELSAAVLYLVSDEAGAVNGAKLPLFGESR
ncbi:MAG: SDR family NAD(P)-dependent oxidoreductase [Chloroflexi bacterium]|nr:SDR family NAD(P)-dependent oxidoreductase [Chloroflexota bacterium]